LLLCRKTVPQAVKQLPGKLYRYFLHHPEHQNEHSHCIEWFVLSQCERRSEKGDSKMELQSVDLYHDWQVFWV